MYCGAAHVTMRLDTLEILRCPYCAGRLALVSTMYHVADADAIHEGVIGCACCLFPVVSGIPVMLVGAQADAAIDHLRHGSPALARRSLFDLEHPWDERFEEAVASAATFREVVEALGPQYEGGYFLYRFSDPSYVVAHALVRAVAGAVLRSGGRTIDICGGAGHLTRAMTDLSGGAPVLADLYFGKLWLARRFTVPGCEAVCCNGNAPLPFARGAFRYAMCADAFMFIWHKRALAGEMLRLTDDGSGRGTAVVSHTHNQLQWSPSLGQALPPAGYRDLFEGIEPRLFAESGLFADVVRGGPLDLSRRDAPEVIEGDPAVCIVASRDEAVFRPHDLELASGAPGELRLNPLYAAEETADGVLLRLQFPSQDYEDEFGACREYLPRTVTLRQSALAALAEGHLPLEVADLRRRRVILDLPKEYY